MCEHENFARFTALPTRPGGQVVAIDLALNPQGSVVMRVVDSDGSSVALDVDRDELIRFAEHILEHLRR